VSYIFRTPVRQPQGPRYAVNSSPHQKALFRHIHHHGGYPVAVYINNGVVGEVNVPTVTQMHEWDVTYMGGRENVVDDVTASLLIAAGYGSCLTPVGDPALATYPYGGLIYGDGVYQGPALGFYGEGTYGIGLFRGTP
jgi:hypothetical protein